MKNLLLFSIGWLLPALSHACAVCFGDPNSNLSRGFFWGILLLLIITFSMISAFAVWIIRASQRHSHEEHQPLA